MGRDELTRLYSDSVSSRVPDLSAVGLAAPHASRLTTKHPTIQTRRTPPMVGGAQLETSTPHRSLVEIDDNLLW